MGSTTFTGPIKAGTVLDSDGSGAVGKIKNVGFAKMVQSAVVTQAGTATAVATGIVIPANSQIVSARLFKSVAWNGAAATFNLGTSATANELAVAADNTGAVIGYTEITPGASATRVGVWKDVGASDVQVYMLSTNTGAGEGTLVVEYVQGNNLS